MAYTGWAGAANGAELAEKGPVAAAVAAPGWALCRKVATPQESDKFPNVPSGAIFGFTSGTGVGEPGDCGVAFEYSGRVGKTDGSYRRGTLETQFGATIADNVSVTLSPFFISHHIRNVTDLDDLNRIQFDGLSGKVRYRFLERSARMPLAATFSVEPRWARVAGTSGIGVTAYSAEFKLSVDAVLIADRLFGAMNFNYAPAVQKTNADPLEEWVRTSSANVSGALTYQLNDRLFIGGELRYLAAFDGAFLNHQIGNAIFAGPTMLVKITDATSLNLVWTPQIRGHAINFDRTRDLVHFEQHQFRAKFAMSF